MEELKSCLQALQAGKHEEDVALETSKQLSACGPQELSEHRKLVAAVYCQLLQYCQSMYEALK